MAFVTLKKQTHGGRKRLAGSVAMNSNGNFRVSEDVIEKAGINGNVEIQIDKDGKRVALKPGGDYKTHRMRRSRAVFVFGKGAIRGIGATCPKKLTELPYKHKNGKVVIDASALCEA